jgi:AraC-like DNA-binding protein
VTVLVDTRQQPVTNRGDTVCETVANTLVFVEIDFAADGAPAAQRAITDVELLRICSLRSTALTTTERAPRLARDILRPSIFVGLQMAGSSVIIQAGREAILRPGDLVVYDSTIPYVLCDSHGVRQHKFRIPLDALALPAEVIRQVLAVALSPGHPIADLAATYLQRLASRTDLSEDPGADAVSQPTVELIRAVITTHVDAVELAKEPIQATLQLRVMAYAHAHLRESKLSAAQIAAEHHISVRHLYKVLAANGVSLGAWIRTHRLEECHKEIGAAGPVDPLASIARRWGFTDPSSFARIFRTAYGMSPREWRDQNHPRTA